jgi:hypothetical protein
MKKFLNDMFSDHSSINAKVVVGFIAFMAIIVYSLTDIVTGAMGIAMVIEPIIFDGLKTTAWVCLGIGGIEAIVGNKNLKNGNE